MNNDSEKNENDKKTKHRRETMRALALVTQLGITIAITLGISLWIGLFLDNHFDTTPIFILIFIVIGLGAALRNMLHLLKK